MLVRNVGKILPPLSQSRNEKHNLTVSGNGNCLAKLNYAA